MGDFMIITQTASIILSLSIALLTGLLLSRLVKIIKLPAVTAYLIAGILVGPFCLGALNIPGIGITKEEIDNLKVSSVIDLMTKLGADRWKDEGTHIIFPTICHNIDASEASMKLYFYKNTKNHLA